jgi:hypothetical protein
MNNYDAVFDPYKSNPFRNVLQYKSSLQRTDSKHDYIQRTHKCPLLQWHYHCQNTPSRISSAAAQVITIAPNFVL